MRAVLRILALSAMVALAPPAMAEGGEHASGGSSEQAPASRQDRLTSAESYLPMPTLSAGILTRYSTQGTVVVDMGIDVQNAELRAHAQHNAPRLRDALRTALSTYANTYYREHTAPDPTTLTRLMQQAVDRTLGAAGAQVLLVNIIYQRRQAAG
jgi:flagellar basal body-associated protein FliL